jgi:AraC-like DNA-binding protein
VAGPELTFAGTYLRHIGALLPPEEVSAWLAAAGLDEATLDDGALTLSLNAFAGLMLDGMARTQEPALGLFLGERLIARTHGFVGYAALNSRSLREVIEVLERFVPVRFSILTVAHEIHADELRLTVTPAIPLGLVTRPLLEAVLMSIRNVLDAVSLGAFEVRALAFSFPAPEYAALARDLVGTAVRYDQPWTGLALDAAAVDTPLKLADPAAFDEAARICQQRLDQLEASETTAGRVRRILLQSTTGFPSLAATARRLHLTPRTLHRRLVAEHTSFRTLVDEVRFRLATDHLAAGHTSIDEIAFILGYTDPANFRRAFRRWSGVPPSAFREQASSAG